jgi:three-Cys-motif partner protein
MSISRKFFDIQSDRSKVKSNIVAKYFSAWANVMLAQRDIQKIAYIDLFSGPGRYKDGNPSTPLLVLENAIKHKTAPQKLQAVFNDSNSQNTDKLKKEIQSLSGVEKFRYEPQVLNRKIDENTVREFDREGSVPTLSFVDPWGYKGLSLSLIRALVKNWGCDSVFFFNYLRLNPAIDNKVLKKPVSLVFSNRVLQAIQDELRDKNPSEREEIIIKGIKKSFKKWGMDYVLTFPFKNLSGRRTTHYLIFVTKSILGCNIMKEIMGNASSNCIQGVPCFEYNAAQFQQPMFVKPLDDLKKHLLEEYSGKCLSMKAIYESDHVDKCFVEKNYKTALLALEEEEKINTNRSRRTPKPRRGTFPNDLIVKFPVGGK